MLRDLAPEQATPGPPDDPPVTGLVVAAAAVRGAAVAVSGVLLTAGLALMIWAVTPASGPDAAVALRGGVTAYALANLMPVSIGGVTLSLPPLLLTAVPVVLLYTTARRGRFTPLGRYQEAVATLTTAGVYGLVVAATTRAYSAPDAVPAGWVWTAFVLAIVATGAGMWRGDSPWSTWFAGATPGWVRVGISGALIGSVALIGAGAMVLTCGLILHFGAAVDVTGVLAPSSLDGLGLAILCLAYLPNAVMAAVGYLSGAGFVVGPGTYSPLATSTVDLPAVPLLAAAPQHDGRTMLGLAALAIPPVVGLLVARPGISRLVTRADRVAAAGLGAALTGVLTAGAAAVAHGGVGDGRWSSMGVPVLLFGPLIAVEVGVAAVLVSALTGWRTVPWQLRDIAEDRTERTAVETTDQPHRGSRRLGLRAGLATWQARRDRTTSNRSADAPPRPAPTTADTVETAETAETAETTDGPPPDEPDADEPDADEQDAAVQAGGEDPDADSADGVRPV